MNLKFSKFRDWEPGKLRASSVIYLGAYEENEASNKRSEAKMEREEDLKYALKRSNILKHALNIQMTMLVSSIQYTYKYAILVAVSNKLSQNVFGQCSSLKFSIINAEKSFLLSFSFSITW